MKRILLGTMLAVGLTCPTLTQAAAGDGGAQGGITPSLSKGTKELVLDGLFDPDTAQGSDLELNVKFGQFVKDRLEFGGLGGVADNDAATSWRLGGFGEINMDMAGPLVPYAGASLAYRYVDFDRGGSRDALELSGEAGAKYFLVNNVAVSAAGVLSWATDDIYPEDHGEVSDTDLRLVLAMRFYLP